MKSVRVAGGKPKPKRLFFPGCSSSYGCQTNGFILSPNREYAAALNVDNDSEDRYLIGLVKLRRGAEPEVLPSPLTVEEHTGAFDSPLAFSPDGTQLVFRRVWFSSPDGTQLVGGDPPALMAVSLAGGDPVPLAESGIPGASLVPDDAAQVQWSRDGRWVAYEEDDFTTDIQRLQVVSTTGEPAPRALATCDFGSPFSFSWSPNSKLIAYDCEGSGANTSQFVAVRPDGTDATNLLGDRNLVYDEREYTGGYEAGPQWSPDGSRLLFLAWGLYSDVDHVYTVRADGSHLTRHG
jgi:dipeptidyl aminopeptidase/acylaminoacyl peptidase